MKTHLIKLFIELITAKSSWEIEKVITKLTKSPDLKIDIRKYLPILKQAATQTINSQSDYALQGLEERLNNLPSFNNLASRHIKIAIDEFLSQVTEHPQISLMLRQVAVHASQEELSLAKKFSQSASENYTSNYTSFGLRHQRNITLLNTDIIANNLEIELLKLSNQILKLEEMYNLGQIDTTTFLEKYKIYALQLESINLQKEKNLIFANWSFSQLENRARKINNQSLFCSEPELLALHCQYEQLSAALELKNVELFVTQGYLTEDDYTKQQKVTEMKNQKIQKKLGIITKIKNPQRELFMQKMSDH